MSKVAPRRRQATPIEGSEPAPRPRGRPPKSKKEAEPAAEEFDEPEELAPGEFSEPAMGEEIDEGAGTLWESTPKEKEVPPPPSRRPARARLKGDPAAMVEVTATDADRFAAARAELISQLDEVLELSIELASVLPSVETGVCVTRLREARWWACEIDPTP